MAEQQTGDADEIDDPDKTGNANKVGDPEKKSGHNKGEPERNSHDPDRRQP